MINNTEPKNLCKKIEEKYGVKILFCVESGSRAYGLNSKTSDYDIRFVFKRPITDYLKLTRPKETINETFKNGLFDMMGFDIYKFGRLLLNSNPTVIEWINSPIIYYGVMPREFKEFANKKYNPIAIFYHYKNMCKNNYLKYIKNNKEVTYKKYLYTLRGLINAKYVSLIKKLPPTDFSKMVEELSKIKVHGEYVLAPNIIEIINKIITFKKTKNKKDIQKNDIIVINEYIENFLKETYSLKSIKIFGSEVENFIIREVMKEE